MRRTTRSVRSVLATAILLLPLCLTSPVRRKRAVSGPPCDTLDLAFLMDLSGTTSDAELTAMKGFVRDVGAFVTMSSADTNVALISFDDSTTTIVEFPGYTSKTDFDSDVGGLTTTSKTAMESLGLDAARASLGVSRSTAPNVVVFVTTSEPTKATASSTAWLIEADDGLVITVAVGSDPTNSNLYTTASTSDHFFSVADENGLSDSAFLDKISTTLCEAAKEDNCATSPCQNGGVCTDLPGQYRCACPPEYGGFSCEFLCGKADIGILSDASGSVKSTNWHNNVVPFHLLLLDKLNIDPSGDEVRVGHVTFSKTSEVDFKLNTYFDRADMQSNIDAIDYDNKYKSSTFTALGLETLRTGVFTGKESDGDRARVPNIALVFTDGGSNMEAHRTGSEAAELHKHTDQTFSLGVSTGINITEVNLIADDLSRALYALDFTVMDTFIETIKKGICERSSYPAQKCMDVDMGFVMDSSLSVTQANWDRMNQFVKDILNHPVNVFGPTNTLVGRVDYSLTSTTIHHLDTYTDKQSIIDAQNSPWLKQLTFTHEGFRLMREDILNPANGERANNRNIVTLVTDGPSNRPSETETEAAALRAVADVYAFGVAGYDPIELLKIVGGDASKVMVAPTFDDLTNAVDLFINGICGNRTNSPCDNPNQCSNGGTCINSAASSGFSCVCPPGYSGSTCGTPTVCTSMDIMYVCDESSSVKQENWTRMTNALADYLDVPVFRRDYAQLGFVEFGIAAEITLALGEYEFGQDLQEQIRQRTYSQGLTYTHEGIKKMMDAFNNPLYDAARTALNPPKVGFIITDGPSTRKSETLIEAETARNAGVDLYVLGVGDGVDYAELEAVSNDVAKVVLASDYSVIGPASNFLHDALCGYNRDDKCDPSPCKNGAKCFNYFSGSSNPVAGYKCVCATGYSGVNCDQEICDTIDLTFVVEDTTVIRPNEFIKVKEALIAATDSSVSTFANSNLRVVTYGSGSATAELDWTAFGGHSNKIDAINQLPSRWVKTLETGMTYAVSSYPSGSTNKKVMVMVVDQYTIYPSRIAQVAALAKAEHIELYALGIDIVMPKAIMDIVGSNSTGHALMVNGFSEAITGLPLLVKAICGDNTYLNPCQGVTCNGKGACVPGLNSYQCACDPGFGGQTCGDTQCYKADLAFVLDSSASLGDENWKSLLYYVSNATRGLDVRTGGTQIGCVSYGYFHRMVFSLNAYHDHGDLGDALVNIAYDRGLTMTDFGISDLYNIVFGTGQGKRTGNEHYGCVITDGRSTKPADTQIQAQEARNQGITMMAIGVKDYDKSELLGIVGGAANNDKVLLLENFDYMTNDIAVNWIRETACGLTRADNPCNTSPCQNGGVCLQHVGSAQNTTYMCDCPSGFTGANCQTQDIPTTCEVADVCVVFDTGVPHTQSDWDSLLHFFNTLSDLRNTGGNSVNFGLYGFNDVETLTIKALGPAQQITSNKPPHFSTTTNSVGLNAALEKCHGSSGHRDNVRYTTLLFTNTPSSSLTKTKEEAQKLRDFGSELFIVSTTLAAYDESVIVAGGTANVTQLNELSDIKYKGKYFNSKLCGLPPPDGRCSGTMMCFLIDVSASLDSHMYSKEIDFVDNVARSQTLGVNDVQVGIVTFGYNTYPKLNAGDGIVQSSIDAVIADLRANQKRELTFIGKGIATARQHCFMNGNSANKKMLMLVTDGTANDAADMGTQAANAKAESNPIEIWALGVGSETDASELRGVASSNDKFIQVSSYDSLVAQYSDIMNLVCG